MYYIKEKDVFYIYYDSVRDVVYVLWNHDTPDGEYFDFGLERVTKLYDEEYQKKLKEEKEKQLYEAVKKKLLEEWNNE